MKILQSDPIVDVGVPPVIAWPTEAEIRAADLESLDAARRQAEPEPPRPDTPAPREVQNPDAAPASRGTAHDHAFEDWLEAKREADGEPTARQGPAVRS